MFIFRDRVFGFVMVACLLLIATPKVQAWSLGIVEPSHIETIAGDRIQSDAMYTFYEERGFKPFWLQSRRRINDMIGAIEQSWTHGLNPRSYYYADIMDLRAQDGDEAQNELEILLTKAYTKYVHDMTGVRIDTRGFKINKSSFKQPLEINSALSLIKGRPNVGQVLSKIEPQSRTYEILRKELMYIASLPVAEQDGDKILTLVANLERLRWVHEGRPDKFIVVNIPQARLWAIDKGEIALDMPVVVGRRARPTYSFVTEVSGVRINPTWTVPKTIKHEDIVPKMRNNPNYMTGKGMELIQGGQTMDPTTIDWENVTAREVNAMRMVQVPGAHNPLGRLRLLMHNGFDIYIHHTNSMSQFARENRAKSSGCVRIKDPEVMLDYVMSKETMNDNLETWTDLFKRRRTKDIVIENPFPVYLLYYTAWVDEQGEVVYGKDIYGMDKKVLNKIDGYAIPVHNSGQT